MSPSVVALLCVVSVIPAHAGIAPPPRHPGDGPVFDGRSHATKVAAPRVAATITVDGKLDEPVWAQAAILTGFSQYAPVDGVPAADSTTVRVWYSPTAIHFGITAYEAHGAPIATLAQRDHIAQDDYVEIYLGTFDDGRHAMVFGVNPLGAQADGVRTETGNVVSNAVAGAAATREPPDLAVRRQRTVGRDERPHARRHRAPRLLADRVRREPARDRPAPGAVLPREAALLSRRDRAARGAEPVDLHAPARAAAGRAQADRPRRGGRGGRALRGRRPHRVGLRRAPGGQCAPR